MFRIDYTKDKCVKVSGIIHSGFILILNFRYALQNKFNESLSQQIQNKQPTIFPNWICTVINNYQQ